MEASCEPLAVKLYFNFDSIQWPGHSVHLRLLANANSLLLHTVNCTAAPEYIEQEIITVGVTVAKMPGLSGVDRGEIIGAEWWFQQLRLSHDFHTLQFQEWCDEQKHPLSGISLAVKRSKESWQIRHS